MADSLKKRGFYDERNAIFGGPGISQWEEAAEFHPLGELPTSDVKHSVQSVSIPPNPPVASDDTDPARPDNTLWGDASGGTPQAYTVAVTDPNDTDGTWETDGMSTNNINGSTPGSNPANATVHQCGTATVSGTLSQASLAS